MVGPESVGKMPAILAVKATMILAAYLPAITHLRNTPRLFTAFRS
jgi:hypothetical protein